MSFSRVGPWSTGQKLTSAQMNTIDVNLSNAFDIRNSQTNTLQSISTIDTTNGGLIQAAGSGTAIQLNGNTKLTLGTAGALIQANVSGASILANASGAVVGANTTGAAVQVSGGANFVAPAPANYTFPATTRSIIAPLKPPHIFSDGTALFGVGALGTASAFSLTKLPYLTDAGFVTQWINTSVGGNSVYIVDITAFMHNGATLSSATLNVAVTTHSGLPTNQLAFSIFRMLLTNVSGTLQSSPPSANCLKVSPNYVQLAAGGVGGYNGQQTLSFTPTQNNLIDKTQYTYIVVIWDEAGTNALSGNNFQSLTLNFNAIGNLGFY